MIKIMKRILYIAGAVLSVAAIAGCNDFLDKMPDNRTEVDSQDKVASILGSAYSNTDFQLLTEYMSDNVDDYGASNPYYDKFIEQVYKWENVTEDNNESPQNIWESNYNAIASANQALDAIEQLGGVDESATLRECKGEALLARAYCHYVLVNIFCNAYNQNTSVKDLGIPYVTESEKTLNPHYERGTVADVYAKLEKDITEGLTLIGDNHLKTPKYHFNTQAAYAFASKFYLSYEKWDKAKECADLCLGSVPTLMDWTSNSALPADPIVRGEDYISSDNSNNLLLETAYSALGLAIGPYSRYSRFAHGFYLANNETAAALHPFGSYANFKCPMFFVTATATVLIRSRNWMRRRFPA